MRTLNGIAKDYDALRFRAPEDINRCIKNLVRQSPNIHFIDTDSAFKANSPFGIIGKELMLEHVHPNLLGYAILSDVFYQSLKRNRFIENEWKNEISFDSLRRAMPITKVDSLKGIYEIMMLKEGWPFNEKMPPVEKGEKTYEEALAGSLAVYQMKWVEAMNLLYIDYIKNKEYQKALKVSEAIILEYPEGQEAYNEAIQLSMNLKEYKTALFYSSKLFKLHPSFEIAKSLFLLYLKMDMPAESIFYIDYAIQTGNSRVNLLPLKEVVNDVLATKEILERDTSKLDAINSIATNYMIIGNFEAALIYINKALMIDKENTVALGMYEKIKSE